MARIEVTDNTLTVHMDGIDRMLALTRRLDIPLDHVVSAAAGAVSAGAKGLAALLARGPGALLTRTFYEQSGRPPWAPPDPQRTLVIGLYNERFSRLVIEVDDPHDAVSAIERAVRTP